MFGDDEKKNVDEKKESAATSPAQTIGGCDRNALPKCLKLERFPKAVRLSIKTSLPGKF